MRFDDVKNLKAIELLEILQTLVQENAQRMSNNSKEINNLQVNSVPSADRNRKISALYYQNKELANNNSEYITMHSKLLKLLSDLQKYDNIIFEEQKSKEQIIEEINDSVHNMPPLNYSKDQKPSYNECFEVTANGDLEFDDNHPYYDDEKFRKKLYEHFIETEQYEKLISMSDK